MTDKYGVVYGGRLGDWLPGYPGGSVEEGRPVSCCCRHHHYVSGISVSCDLPRSAFPRWKTWYQGPCSGQLEERFLGERLPGLVIEKVTWPSDFAQGSRASYLKSQGRTQVSRSQPGSYCQTTRDRESHSENSDLGPVEPEQ